MVLLWPMDIPPEAEPVDLELGLRLGVVLIPELELETATKSGAMETCIAPLGGGLSPKTTTNCSSSRVKNVEFPNINVAPSMVHLYAPCWRSTYCRRGEVPVYELVPTYAPALRS